MLIGPHVPVREVRKAHGLTLPDLADRIAEYYGTRPNEDSLSNIELGRKKGSQRLMTAWARALRLNPVDVRQKDELRALVVGEPKQDSDAQGRAA